MRKGWGKYGIASTDFVHKGFLTYCGVIPICYAVPPVPSDQEVKKAADKLASSGVKNGHQFENFMHQKNPGYTPFQYAFRQGNGM
jgi:hypothetical protein